VFFDDVKTLYDLDQPETHRILVDQSYSDYRKGTTARLDQLAYLPLSEIKVIDLDTGQALAATGGAAKSVRLEVPITDDRQSAHLRVTGTLQDEGYSLVNGELRFDRTMRGLRNTVLLPAGWNISASSQSGTIGTYRGRTFIAFINLNAENSYRVVIRGRRSTKS